MKIVGIIARPDKTSKSNDVVVVNKKLLEVLDRYNINILVITPPCKYNYTNFNYKNGPKITTQELNKMLKLINMCNGIILQGGNEFYDFDIKIIDYLHKNNIPTLGICLGMQSMSYYKAAKYLKVNNHYNTNHLVKINKNTKLYNILRSEKILVCSKHNYQIKNTSFIINATSEDNVIEGIEDQTKTFFLSLQWHPEVKDDIYQKRIFQSFIDSL